MTINDVTQAMQDHDREYTPGSESAQWQVYLADVWSTYGDPTEIGEREMASATDKCFALYWLAVAAHDWDTAAHHGEVNLAWIADYA